MPKQVSAYTSAGKSSGKITLPSAVFGGKVNRSLLAQAVRVFLSNQRRGLAKAKGRGELTSITTAKIWRQKGTGRARHGSKRAPIFVGGGKAHGPTGTQNYSLDLPKKMRQAALKSALAAQADQVVVITDLSSLTGKTKVAVKLLKALQGKDKPAKKVLVVLDKSEPQAARSSRNLPQARLQRVETLTTYEVLGADQIVFTKAGVALLEKRLAPATKEQ